MGIRKPARYPFDPHDTWTSKDGRVTSVMHMDATHLERTIDKLMHALGEEAMIYEMNHILGKPTNEAFPDAIGAWKHRRFRHNYRFNTVLRMRGELEWRKPKGEI